MSNRTQSESAPTKSLAYIILIIVVMVKVFQALMNVVVKTYDGIAATRAHRA